MPQKLTKITEYLYKILLILLIFLNLKTSNMPSNKHPRKMSTSRGSSLNAYQTYSWYKERIKYFFGCTVYLARKCTLNTSQVFWVSKWKYLKQIRYTRVFNNNESDIANLFGYSIQQAKLCKIGAFSKSLARFKISISRSILRQNLYATHQNLS